MVNTVIPSNTHLQAQKGRNFIPASEAPVPQWPCPMIKHQEPTLTLKDNDLFLITNTLGNIAGCLDDQVNTSLGLFCRDTRFLSRLDLQIEGQLPILLSSTAQRGFALSVLCANPSLPNHMTAETIGIHRDIVLQGGLLEELTVRNYSNQAVEFELSLSFDADFADLFEVRGKQRLQQGTPLRWVEQDQNGVPTHVGSNGRLGGRHTESLIMAYRGLDDAIIESRVEFYRRPPHHFEGYTAIWKIALNAQETQVLGYRLQPFVNDRLASSVSIPANLSQAIAAEEKEEEKWHESITRIRTDNQALNQVIEQAEADIFLLHQSFDDDMVLAAGTPWYATLFGRDSLIAAAQTLMLNPSIARQTLKVLARYQGEKDDEWREEEPGKILHELRLGEMARCDEIPHTPYYGTVDATPLWLMLYADYFDWTGDGSFVDELWGQALAAMEWIDRGCEATGYLTYKHREQVQKGFKGLKNQGWKDSSVCMVDGRGRLAEGAIALSEVQGYVYAAKMRMIKLAQRQNRLDLATQWASDAKVLKERFNQDFWLPHQGYVALALDGQGTPLDSITSNPGHCLGLGLLDEDKAQSVAERLRAPDMFNGWGIRTLSSSSPAYNPMGYHVGSVWPHDNGLIASGLRMIGEIDQAMEITDALFAMTLTQPYFRPPELFCGFDRVPKEKPVRYPVACSPQAWATGTIFQLLHLMVNLWPDAANNCLRIQHPTLPSSIQSMTVENLTIGSTVLDLEFEQSSGVTACRVVNKRGNLSVVIEA